LPPELLEDLAPDLLHRYRVRLVHQRHVLALTLARELQRVAQDPLDTGPREPHRHDGGLAGRPDVGPLAGRGVNVFGVLTDDRHPNLMRPLALERGEPIVVEDDRPQVHVQVEPAPQADDDVALDHPAWRVWMADRAHEHRILRADWRHLLRRQALAGRQVVRSGARETGALGVNAEATLARVQDLQAGRGSLW